MKSSKFIKPQKGMKVKVLQAPQGFPHVVGKVGNIVCLKNGYGETPKVGIKFPGRLDGGNTLNNHISTYNGLYFTTYLWNKGSLEILKGINWREVFKKK